MTDTGQVPGEGLPESAGMVEQPGVPPHGAYTYLSESPAEDEDLLLPGSQGAWGNEVPPPAPEPVVEAVHQQGAHEASGRDSGSVDLGGVLHHDPAHTPPPGPGAPVPPRRPLHLGPPIPDASASPVRSLADRGPAGAPVRQPGPPTAGPEYLDVPQGEMAPQGAAPWGAQAAAPAPQAPVVAQVSAEAAAAETVVPGAEAGDAAQAAMARLAAQAGAAAPAAHPLPGGQVPAGGEAVAPQAGDPAAAAVAQTPDAAGAVAAVGPEAPQAGAVQFTETGQAPEAAGALGSDGVPESGGVPAAVPAPEAGPAPGAEHVTGAEQAAGADQVGGAEQASGAEQAAGVQQVGGAVEVPQEAAAEALHAADAQGAVEGRQAGGAERVSGAEQAAGVQQVVEAEQVGGVVEVPHDVAADAPHVAEAQGAAEGPQVAGAEQAAEGPLVAGAQAGEVAEVAQEAAAEPVHPAEAQGAAEGPQVAGAEQVSGAEQVAGAEQVSGAEQVAGARQVAEAQQVAGAVDVPHGAGAPGVVGEGVDSGAPAPADGTATPPVGFAVPGEAQGPQVGQAPDEAPAAHIHFVDAVAHDPNTPESRPALLVDAAAAQAAQAAQAAGATAPADSATAQPAEPQPESDGSPAGPEATEGTAPGAPDEQRPEAAVPAGVPAQPGPDQPLGQFVPVDGSVPTMPHLAPTPPHPIVLPADRAEPVDAAPQEPVVTVPAPRDGEPVPAAPDVAEESAPLAAQQADDLDTHVADHQGPQQQHNPQHTQGRQEGQEESTAAVAEVRQSTGPAAPGYEEAEREAVLKVMRERRDIRNGFRSDPIPHEVLLRVLEAAHTAPSVGHSQPWDFVVIRSADTRRAMHELAMRQRDAYAKSLPKGRAKQFKELKIEAILDTPVNIVVTADPTRGGRHTLGRHTQPQMAPYSAALAVENLWLAARAEGLGVGWVSFFDEREMVRVLGLPEHLEVIAYLCVGYVDEFPDEPELMQAGWSKRRPLSWVVHEETYGRRALPGEDPHDLLAETVAQIRPLDAKALGEAWERQKRMTKPAGALGMLEIISAQLSGLSRQCPPPIPEPAAVAIFAGDHGVHAQGVTPWPQEVTAQMVANFLGGGAVCNAFAGQVGAEVCVVDVGVAADLPATPGLLPRKIRAGTSDMTTGPAMTREEAKKAIEVGIETARDLVAAGNKALLTGEMGIANTTASAALISVFTGADPAEVTGRGTGINDETLARKTEVVRRAIEVHQPDPADPIGVLAAIGGFEHAAMVGLLLGGASLRTPVILDGVSAGAAALVARAIAPEVLAACIAGHRSAEPGHVAALNKLGLRPLVDLDLRLGEGTGALLALPLVQSTARAMHEVATFDSAGVTEK
ncbi:nicotinate-nucleotide--dimethylbenzimidazole phosphoribosyltransferase [Streptomyces anandii]|uniref:nicotinate-nucleotide--dimethylbenzimidazole phosphoribosyltransferase n=1 Tax=Streptomyces anandii TaxID=285454 RepID=UPI0036D097E9